jgi:hypothetical protein
MADIYLAISETPTVVTLTSAVIASSASSTVTVSNFPATQAVSLASVPTHAITGTVTVSSLPAISGTVTANCIARAVHDGSDPQYYPLPVIGYDETIEGANRQLVVPVQISIDQGSVNSNNPLPISGTVTIGSALPTGTNRIGVVTIGAGTVTIGAGTAQIGSVTASISGTVPISISSVTIGNFPATQPVSLASLPALVAGTAQIGSVTVGNSVTIGSLPAISGTVTANIAISSSAITSGSFASLTSATLVPANTARKMATVYNLGPGQLFVNAGASATTLGGGFMVALSSSDYLECDYTTTTLSALFASAGTASWVSH